MRIVHAVPHFSVLIATLLVTGSPAALHAQELGPDRQAEAEFFRNVMEATGSIDGYEAVNTSTSPTLIDPRQDPTNGRATEYGIAPARPPMDLPFDIDSSLSLPFKLDSLSNPQVLGFIAYYCTDGRRQLNRWIARSGRYKEIIVKEAKRQGAPTDVLWVVAVESAFNPHAVSYAGAEGLWQFMPRTGSYLGLRIGSYVDERRDPYISTVYGIDYLLQLHETFRSWPLALAAYNAGMGHVRGELRKANANDFEKLDDYHAIYTNARNYAGRIIAIATIMRNPQHFGFNGIVRDEPMVWDEVQVEGQRTFEQIARDAGTQRELIEQLNPGLIRGVTPPDETTTVRIPLGTYETYARANSNHIADKTRTYTLRFGETINDVANALHLSPYLLRNLNGFGSREKVAYGTTIEIPEGAEFHREIPDEPTPVIVPETRFTYSDRTRIFYEIRPRDTLRDIAKHFNVNMNILAGWNDLTPGSALWSGMTLQIYIPTGTTLSDTIYLEESDVRTLPINSEEYWDFRQKRRQRGTGKSRTHTVESGDTVSEIADEYGIRSSDIIRWNGLDSAGHIEIGQNLQVAP